MQEILTLTFTMLWSAIGAGIDANLDYLVALLFLLPIALGPVIPGGFPGKAMFDTIQPGGEHAEDVSPMVRILSPSITPFLNVIGIGGSPILNSRYEWLEDELIPDSTTLSGAVNAAAVVLSVPNANIFQEGEQIIVGSIPTQENMLVTAINGIANTITVTRSLGEAPAVAHASGENVLLGGEVSIEGANAPNSQKTTMERPFNISHIFNGKLEMTGTRTASIIAHLGDIGDEWAYTKTKRLKELMRDLEASILFSDWTFVNDVPTIGSSTVRRTMRGIVPFLQFGVRFNAGGTTLPPAACFADQANRPFTFDNFRTFMQTVVYNNGAQEGQANLLLVPPSLKESVGKWKRTAQGLMDVSTTMESQNITEIVGVIETDFGRVMVLMVPRLRLTGNNVALLLSSSLVTPKSYAGRSFFTNPLGRTGDRREEELVGEYGLEMVGITQGWHCLAYNWAAI